MARTKISEFSATPGDNTDIDGIDIAEGCAPSGINNAIRELMAQLKDMQTGSSGDTFTLTTVNSTTVDTTNLEATNLKAKDGTAAGSIANSTGVVTLASSVLTTTDINGGTVDGTTIGATTPSTVVATQVDITAQGDLRLQDTTGGQYVALQAPGTIATSYTLTLPVDDGTSGQALITDGSGVLSWSSAASGDVYGPASATDNAVARYDGTTGKIIQNSAVTIADTTGDMAGVGTLTLNSTLGVKTAASAEYNILVGGNLTGGANSGGLRFQSQIQSDVTSNARGIISIPSTAAAAFTIGNLEHFFAGQGSLGAGSAISNQYGYRAASSLTGATNNYGFFGDIASGTGRWNFYAAGTADNYFAGNVGIGTTTPLAALNVTGQIRIDGNTTDPNNGAPYLFQQSGIGWVLASTNVTLNTGGSGTRVERMRIASSGTISLGAAPGAESLRVTPVASAVNFIEAFGAATANRPVFRASGSDTNIGIEYQTKAAGVHLFRTDFDKTQFVIAHTASAVNYIQVTGAADAFPKLSAQGSFSNIAMVYDTKGNQSHIFQTNGGTNQFQISHTASAVNYLQVQGNAAGSAPFMSAQGSDANINMFLSSKGTGNHVFSSGGGIQFVITNTASAVNNFFATGSATGAGVLLAASGSDTNIDIRLLAKGTGVLSFGTLTANADAPVTGYILIKDSGGTTRKLAVIA
jgi:hypothetical protein